ncbi:MAG TPA: DUF433 domain-containing protein, partial [Pyrinomonadaceae bacterium]
IRFKFPHGVPLVQWEDGSVRVQGTRLLLAMIVSSFQQGNNPDQIHDSFPSASVTEIGAVIDWYLNNRPEADAYLDEYYAEGERLRLEIQSTPEYKVQSELLKRKREEFLQQRQEQMIKS